MYSPCKSALTAARRPLLLCGASCLALAAGFVAPASASCNITGTAISSQCDVNFIKFYMDEGTSSLTVSGETTVGIEFAPHPTMTGPTDQTLHITGGTVVNNPAYSGVYSYTEVPDHDLSVTVDAGVQITSTGGFGGIWLRNQISGDLSITNSGMVDAHGAGSPGISLTTNLGSVSLTNNGDVTSANDFGLYADGGYNNTSASEAVVLLVNNGTVQGFTAGARAVNYHGLASVTNTGTVTSDTGRGLSAWAQNGRAVVNNSGTSIAYDNNAMVVLSDYGDVTAINSGSLTAYNDTGITDWQTGHNGIRTDAEFSGTTRITNTATGTVLAPDDTAIMAIAEHVGDIFIDNAGSVSGKNGIAATTASGRIDITNSGTVVGTNGDGVILTGASLTNSGSIEGSDSGVELIGTGNTVTTSGRITGTTASIHFGAGGNTLNILQGASFGKEVDYADTIGNTTTFGAGNYSIPSANYIDASNVIALNNSTQVVVLKNVGTSGTSGTINVVTVPAASQAATQYTSSVSDVVGSILSLDVARPDQGTVGDSAITALQYGEGTPESTEAKAVRQLGDGVAVDGYGNLFWARAFGGLRYQRDNNGDPASHTAHYGLISGFDHQFENYRVGFFAGGGNVRTATSGEASTVSGNTGFMGVYGAAKFNGLQWNASLTAGAIDNRADRLVNGTDTASGDFLGWYVSPEVAVSNTYAVAPGWELTPSAKIRYTGAFYESYSESGSTSQLLSYDSRQTHSLDGRVQLELKHKMVMSSGLPAAVMATVALGDTQYLGSGKTHASLLGSDFTVANSGDDNVLGATIGLGFDAMVSKRAAIYGSVDGTIYSDDSMGATGRLGLKVAF
jgi:hypothetical protein